MVVAFLEYKLLRESEKLPYLVRKLPIQQQCADKAANKITFLVKNKNIKN